ncbi:DUF6457 domain-containing protein [Subtercola boreus]|uniref:DUF6457 domain-containing protein n=1 Tax=Subtercola boreus TaxID=120213 RepID=UPI001C0E9421|nr:DUF6457 domain-containing protein [Subtercola boreus]
MNRTDDEAQRETLDDWSADLADALRLAGLEVGVEVEVDAILALAGDAAHTVLRPAAPLTTFIVGFAAGRAVGASSSSAPPELAVAEAIQTAQTLIGEYGEAARPAHPVGADIPPAAGDAARSAPSAGDSNRADIPPAAGE